MSPPEGIAGKVTAEGEIYFTPEFFEDFGDLFKDMISSQVVEPLEKILQEPERLDWYSIREFPLDTARNNEMIMGFPEQGGDIILVISYTGKAEIKFDNANSDSFDLEVYSKIRHTYTDIYLSNEAQIGDTIKILFGRGDWEITDTVTEIDLSGAIRNDQLDQITDPLKIGQIIRNSHIIPHADIACEKILISGTTRLDQWRSADDYTYMDPGRILLHAAATLSDWRHPTDLTLINGGQIFTHSIEANKLSILTHILTGAIWVNNSPAAGWVAWTGAQITYNGNTYNIDDGNTNQAYIWWDFSLSTTTFQTANVKPALTDDDCIVCYNNGGIHELIWNATLIDGRTIRTGTVTADEINVIGLNAAGRIVVGDATDADEVTAGVNAFATTLILPGKIIISGGTNLEDWRSAGDLTLIDGGDIFANSVTAVQAQFDDLINVSNLFTLAAGRVVISKNAFGANLEGILINDGVRNRVEIGELTAGVYGITTRDSTGERTMLAGDHRSTTRVSVNLSAQQSNIPDATVTKVLLNAEWFDPGNNFSLVNNRFIAPRDGYYMFNGQIAWTNLPADEAAISRLMKNGVAGTRLASGTAVFNSTPNLYAVAGASTLVWLDEDDYVELFGAHWVGNNTPDIYGWVGRGETFLTVHYVWGGV